MERVYSMDGVFDKSRFPESDFYSMDGKIHWSTSPTRIAITGTLNGQLYESSFNDLTTFPLFLRSLGVSNPRDLVGIVVKGIFNSGTSDLVGIVA
jgi:hypothetical protein